MSEHGGTKTYWQPVDTGKEAGGDTEGLVRVRVEGAVDCSVMEQLAVIREADNYRRWMPLCQVRV